MSANIYYRIVGLTNPEIEVSAPSSFVAAMDRVFGQSHPWKLNEAHIEALRGMTALSSDGARINPYESIIVIIMGDAGSSRSIEVWPEY